ncbi:MAG: hypothetical protein ABJP48_06830 [Erythrobacter sp.]
MKSLISSRIRPATLGCATAFLLSACATVPPPSPIEVTRFHQAEALQQTERGVFFVEFAPSIENPGLELAPYKAAVASELSTLGYEEGSRDTATTIAQISIAQFEVDRLGQNRGPVSVGVGGRTGSFGTGVGLGIGINLGGGSRSGPQIGTELSVSLRTAENGVPAASNLWEGRAEVRISQQSPESAPTSTAELLASALFDEFPGNNGETITIEPRNLEANE